MDRKLHDDIRDKIMEALKLLIIGFRDEYKCKIDYQLNLKIEDNKEEIIN